MENRKIENINVEKNGEKKSTIRKAEQADRFSQQKVKNKSHISGKALRINENTVPEN